MTKTPKVLKAAPCEPCRHDAAYVAHMLCYSPFDVFPYGPETPPKVTITWSLMSPRRSMG